MLAEKIADWEDSLAKENIKLAYLPSPSMVRLRMSVEGENKMQLESLVKKKLEEVLPLIKGYVYGYDEETLPEVLGKLLREKNKTVSIAESCTGGMIAEMITSVPGSSDYFPGSIVTYANEIKINELGVKKETLDKYGAVSEETVLQMAEGVRKKFKTDYSISVSGIAGPGGGTEEKPVGTVWLAVAGAEGTFAKKFQFGDNRGRNIERSAITGLAMLRKFILGELE
jgi:nicotinamide-nucleotide amidase